MEVFLKFYEILSNNSKVSTIQNYPKCIRMILLQKESEITLDIIKAISKEEVYQLKTPSSNIKFALFIDTHFFGGGEFSVENFKQKIYVENINNGNIKFSKYSFSNEKLRALTIILKCYNPIKLNENSLFKTFNNNSLANYQKNTEKIPKISKLIKSDKLDNNAPDSFRRYSKNKHRRIFSTELTDNHLDSSIKHPKKVNKSRIKNLNVSATQSGFSPSEKSRHRYKSVVKNISMFDDQENNIHKSLTNGLKGKEDFKENYKENYRDNYKENSAMKNNYSKDNYKDSYKENSREKYKDYKEFTKDYKENYKETTKEHNKKSSTKLKSPKPSLYDYKELSKIKQLNLNNDSEDDYLTKNDLKHDKSAEKIDKKTAKKRRVNSFANKNSKTINSVQNTEKTPHKPEKKYSQNLDTELMEEQIINKSFENEIKNDNLIITNIDDGYEFIQQFKYIDINTYINLQKDLMLLYNETNLTDIKQSNLPLECQYLIEKMIELFHEYFSLYKTLKNQNEDMYYKITFFIKEYKNDRKKLDKLINIRDSNILKENIKNLFSKKAVEDEKNNLKKQIKMYEEISGYKSSDIENEIKFKEKNTAILKDIFKKIYEKNKNFVDKKQSKLIETLNLNLINNNNNNNNNKTQIFNNDSYFKSIDKKPKKIEEKLSNGLIKTECDSAKSNTNTVTLRQSKDIKKASTNKKESSTFSNTCKIIPKSFKDFSSTNPIAKRKLLKNYNKF